MEKYIYYLCQTKENTTTQAVYDFLTSKGYTVQTQVGCSGFRIDMAVKQPQLSGVFAIGIECDGATYHSARTARERDRIRQTILEDMGWTIHRIWSTDWINNQKTEEQRLIEAVERALNRPQHDYSEDYSTTIEEPEESVAPSPIVEIEEVVEEEEMPRKTHGFIPYQQTVIEECTYTPAADAIKIVIEKEQPIHFEDLCKRVAPLFGNQKATSKVRNKVGYYLNNDLHTEIVRKGDFITVLGFDDLQVRIPDESDTYIRPIEFISDDEIGLAILTLIENSFGLTPDDLLVETARKFGFKRTGENIGNALRRVYQSLSDSGKIKEIDGKAAIVNNA